MLGALALAGHGASRTIRRLRIVRLHVDPRPFCQRSCRSGVMSSGGLSNIQLPANHGTSRLEGSFCSSLATDDFHSMLYEIIGS